MSFSVKYSSRAIKSLKKMGRGNAAMIYSWIGKNLIETDNPYAKGKPLVEYKKGQWRYRVGNFRLICEIQNDELIILLLELGHRKSIYR